VLGYEGKWAIHPSQIELANGVFTPSDAEVTKARRILAAMEQAAKEGKGAVSLDGRLIDIASIRMAEALIAKADSIARPSRAEPFSGWGRRAPLRRTPAQSTHAFHFCRTVPPARRSGADDRGRGGRAQSRAACGGEGALQAG
jgi:hypothetical protein